jgi:hypothetical protein
MPISPTVWTINCNAMDSKSIRILRCPLETVESVSAKLLLPHTSRGLERGATLTSTLYWLETELLARGDLHTDRGSCTYSVGPGVKIGIPVNLGH